jgi:hypothetical protein
MVVHGGNMFYYVVLCSMLNTSVGCMRCIIDCMWHLCLYCKCLGFCSLSHLAVVAVAI